MTRNSGKNSQRSVGLDWARPWVRRLLSAIERIPFARSIARRFRSRWSDITNSAEVDGSNVGSKTNDYALSPAQSALWDAVLGSFSNLKERERAKYDSHVDAVLFHAAQPRHYVAQYRLRVWQRILCPFHCASFTRRKRLLATLPTGSKNAEELIQRIDDDLAFIEFAGKSLGHQLRYRTRREMLLKQLSPWKIRASFVSTSIVCRGNHITARRVSGGVYWPFRIGREVLLAFAAWSVAFAVWEMATRSCLTCNSLGLLYLSDFLILFGYLAHIGGPERRQAERFLASMKLLECEDG
jgi:hypothetical protein